MSIGRDWREFNDEWRKFQPLRGWLRRNSHGLRYRIRRISDNPQRFVKEAEPWGILAAAIGLILAVASFWYDYMDRIEGRTVQAWQLVTTSAIGNSGKIEALEYLNKEDGMFCSDGRCKFALKKKTPLIGIDLSYATFGGEVYLQGADLKFVNLSRANLSEVNLKDASLAGSYLSDINLSKADLSGADLSFARLYFSNLKETYLFKATLVRADFSHADLRGAELGETDLRGASLQGADLREASLIAADLKYANLRNANLGDAWMLEADLSGADLGKFVRVGGTGEVLTDAREMSRYPQDELFFEEATISQDILNEACGDEHTQLPRGMTIPKCSEVDWYERVHGES